MRGTGKRKTILAVAVVMATAIGAITVLSWLSVATPVMANAMGLAAEKVYIIPEESSLWRFRPTVMNTGSGDWWLYGEDADCYYHFEGSKEVAYHAFKRSDVSQCPDFNPHNYETWCENLVVPRKSARITEFWEE
ncbi:hypothetical protein [Verrucomicrobium spinosum]|uniref:hypothetical protein n=2 Tax=Verrucomicrobium spinosum TaxID=2736 RepID=UPI0001745689|nr:hypothetical protein [Verrucomicrobium spinosum]